MGETYAVNLFLPFMLGVVVVGVSTVAGLVFWLLNRSNVIQITNKNNLLSILKDVVLTIVGFITFLLLLGCVILVIEMIRGLFSKAI